MFEHVVKYWLCTALRADDMVGDLITRDFQQTLLVILKGNKEEIVGACIQRSPLWHCVKALHLTENMCVDPHDPQSAWFAQWLSDVGQGKDLPLDHSPTHDLWTRSLKPHLSQLSYSPKWLGDLRQVLFGVCHSLS